MLTFCPFTTASGAVVARPGPRGTEKERCGVAAVCDLCGKKPSFGMSLSHSHRRNKRRWDPNIQRVRALVDGSPVRIHVCTSCIRAGKVTKPPRRVPTAG
jgi:large subunit ribosomal protein L28